MNFDNHDETCLEEHNNKVASGLFAITFIAVGLLVFLLAV